MEQNEPIDLSLNSKINQRTEKNSLDQVETNNYFENNHEAFPIPLNINEATLSILKNIYDIRYHRKPNCDQIFSGDPANPKLYVCKLCAKHVRSKWHHFQTHYSRDHRCSECDAVYSRIDTLRTHAKKRHQTVIPRYYCGIPANIWHRSIVKYAAATAAAAAAAAVGPSRAPVAVTRHRPTKSGTPPDALRHRTAGN